MDGDAVRAIAEEAAKAAWPDPKLLEVPGYKELAIPSSSGDGSNEWTFKPLPVAPVAPPVLVVHTLSGLVAYVEENRDKLKLDELTVHVVNHESVEVFGALTSGEIKARPLYARAVTQALYPQARGVEGFDLFRAGAWLDPETFVIGLQVYFDDTDDRAKILSVVGNIRDEGVTTWDDDGVSQAVTAGSGVKLGKLVGVPNPVTLRPWRTFRDLQQPTSRYVLRARGKGTGTTPQLALFEADGGEWKVDAIGIAATFLRDNLPDEVIVVA